MKRSTSTNSAALAFAASSCSNNNNNYSTKIINSNIDSDFNIANNYFNSFLKHYPSIYEPIDNDVSTLTQFSTNQSSAFNYDYYQSQTSLDIGKASFLEGLQKQDNRLLPDLLSDSGKQQKQTVNVDQKRSLLALSSDFDEIWKQRKSASGNPKKFV